MLEGLRLALTTFTVLPSPPGRVDRRTAGFAMLWSPLVGAALAMVAAAVLLAGRSVFGGPVVWVHATRSAAFVPPLLPSALAVIALALLTRGLHLDGLADTVDGLASHKPAPQALAVMSDGPIGALGAAALVLCLLTDVLALSASVSEQRGTQALVMAVVTGRLAMLWACTRGVPPARPDGMGALVAGTVSRRAALAWTAIVVIGAGVYGRLDTDIGSPHGAARAAAAVVIALGVTWAVRRHVVRRLGGITGDVLGGLCELAVLVSLLVTASGAP
jgi:adenosylcobinamide-GDP ribazoletransferase